MEILQVLVKCLLFQVGTQFRGKYNNHQLGGPMAADRGSSWMAQTLLISQA